MNSRQRKEAFQAKTFRLMLSVLGIFGIPVFIIYMVGQYLGRDVALTPEQWLPLLAISFVFSWMLVIRMYIRLEKERKLLDQELEDDTNE